MDSTKNSDDKKKSPKPKAVKLRAFKIENHDVSKSVSPAKQQVITKLTGTSTVKERCMILNSEDPKKEQDLISYYQTSETSNSVFCNMMRVTPSEGVEKIPDLLFEKPSFTMSDLQNADIDTSVICKNHFYFCMNDKFLVTNLPLNKTISSLQTYICWLANNELIEFTPMIVKNKQTQLKDLELMSIRDPSPIMQTDSGNEITEENQEKSAKGTAIATSEEKNTKIKLTTSVINAIKAVMPSLPNLKEIVDNQIVSAELLIKFNKPRSMDEEDYARILGATLKPVSDLDNIVFKRKDGRRDVKGKDLLKIKNVLIDVTESGKLVDQKVFQEMSKYLIEIESETTGN
ncbi:hypothetical protein [Providencia hangzhouensis]|uniref:hypothetical protein n=1 Tax=Providencia hangzhouensis TaxID=3031799 RepID=UPI003F4A2608